MHRTRRRSQAAAAVALATLMAGSPAAAGLHVPGHKARAAIAANEGSWLVRAGAVQDLYANIGKHPLPLVVYLCTRADSLAAPRVQLQILGRAPVDIQGCQSVYLLLASGERLAIVNPNPVTVGGTYKLDLQGKVR